MDNSLTWLIAANIAVWAGLGLYLIIMGRRQAALDKRLRQLETLRND